MPKNVMTAGSIGLDSILEPMGRQRFMKEYLNKNFLYLKGASERFTSLLQWDEFNRILEHPQSASYLRLYQDGNPIPVDSYTKSGKVSTVELTDVLRNGATLIVNHIDRMHRPIGDLAMKIGRALGCSVGINAYGAWGTSNGFGVHYDSHDTLILQLYGQKDWQVVGTKEIPGAAPLWEGRMTPGDILYIPRGWFHFAKPCNEPSLHLTTGMYSPNFSEMVLWAIKEMSGEECMSAVIPRCSTQDREMALERVRNAITNVLQSEIIDRYLDEVGINPTVLSNIVTLPRTRLGLPWSARQTVLPDSDRYRICLLASTMDIRSAGEGDIELRWDKRVLTVEEATRPLLEFLDRDEDLTLAEFYQQWQAEFDIDDLRGFVTSMVKNGVITLDPPHPGN